MTVLAICLDAKDDVAVVLAPVGAGDCVSIRSQADRLIAAQTIPIYHKIALHDLPVGAPLRRGGIVIGRTTSPITKGSHVHVHNLASQRARAQTQTTVTS